MSCGGEKGGEDKKFTENSKTQALQASVQETDGSQDNSSDSRGGGYLTQETDRGDGAIANPTIGSTSPVLDYLKSNGSTLTTATDKADKADTDNKPVIQQQKSCTSNDDNEDSGRYSFSNGTEIEAARQEPDRGKEPTAAAAAETPRIPLIRQRLRKKFYWHHHRVRPPPPPPPPPPRQVSSHGLIETQYEVQLTHILLLMWCLPFLYGLVLVWYLDSHTTITTPSNYSFLSQVQLANRIRMRWYSSSLGPGQNFGLVQRGTPLADSTNRITGPQVTILGRVRDFQLIRMNGSGSIYARMRVPREYLPRLRMMVLFYQQMLQYPSIPYLHGIDWHTNYCNLYYHLVRVNSLVILHQDPSNNTITQNCQVIVRRYSFELPSGTQQRDWLEFVRIPLELLPVYGEIYLTLVVNHPGD